MFCVALIGLVGYLVFINYNKIDAMVVAAKNAMLSAYNSCKFVVVNYNPVALVKKLLK